MTDRPPRERSKTPWWLHGGPDWRAIVVVVGVVVLVFALLLFLRTVLGPMLSPATP